MKNALTQLLAFGLIVLGFSCLAGAQYATVEIEKVQVVKSMSGVVRDTSGAPIVGATVAEVSADWKTVIQSTVTDTNGNFTLPPMNKRRIRHLMISMNNFNPLVVHVKVSGWTSKVLDLQLHVAT